MFGSWQSQCFSVNSSSVFLKVRNESDGCCERNARVARVSVDHVRPLAWLMFQVLDSAPIRSLPHMQNANQEVHLWPVMVDHGPLLESALPSALRLPFGPTMLTDDVLASPSLRAPPRSAAAPGVLVESFFNPSKQLRLLAWFPAASVPQVNGAPAPHWVVLAPGDFFQWAPGLGFRVALFNKPHIGPPSATVLGKPCPVCRVPFAANSTCVTCICGIVLHCEPDDKEGLPCAQMRRECPVCQRSIVLTEGYVNPPSYED